MLRLLAAALCLSTAFAFAQAPDQPGVQYASYTLLLVPQKGEGFLVAIDKQQKIVFIPISSITKAVDEDGVSPVHYGELLQLLRQLGEENQRLKAENDHLWRVVENRPAGAPAPVIVQQTPPQPDPDAERRQMRQVLLRSLLTPHSTTVNVNVTDCTKYPALCTH